MVFEGYYVQSKGLVHKWLSAFVDLYNHFK